MGQQPGTKSGRGPANRLSSTACCVPRSGLHRISFVRASEELSRTVFFGALEAKIDGSLLGEQPRRHPVPPRPVPPDRRAPLHLAPPVVCPGVGFDRLDLINSCPRGYVHDGRLCGLEIGMKGWAWTRNPARPRPDPPSPDRLRLRQGMY